MPYDEDLDLRIRKIVSPWKNTDAKKMFGGVCHLLNGNMVAGVWKDYLIARVGEEEMVKALKLKNVKPFDITGRPMKGWIMVAADGVKTEAHVKTWLEKAKRFVAALPSK